MDLDSDGERLNPLLALLPVTLPLAVILIKPSFPCVLVGVELRDLLVFLEEGLLKRLRGSEV